MQRLMEVLELSPQTLGDAYANNIKSGAFIAGLEQIIYANPEEASIKSPGCRKPRHSPVSHSKPADAAAEVSYSRKSHSTKGRSLCERDGCRSL